MRRSMIWLSAILMFACVASSVAQAECVTIQMGLKYGTGHYLDGQPLRIGYDVYGYNYQAHMFDGSYFNVYAGGDGFPPYDGNDAAYEAANPAVVGHWAWPYRKDNVTMKWNDAWLSNQDCNDDGKLDRPDDNGTYIGSGAWTTNHMSGSYVPGGGKQAGKEVNWIYFVKIVAAPADASLNSGVWYTKSNVEIGPAIWDGFAVIQEIYNDPAAGAHGLLYKSQASPGFGRYRP